MRLRPVVRVRVCVGFVVAALVAGGCSSNAAEVPVTAATIVTAPITSSAATTTSLTSTTAVTSTTATSATAVTSTTAETGTTAATTSTTLSVNPATTAAPTTAALTAAADYTPVGGPAVGDQTNAIDPGWLGADGVTLTTVADGAYWATLAGEGDSPQRFVNFRLTQAFFGAACTAKFGADSCDNDFATLAAPTGGFRLYLGTARLTVADAVTQKSFQVTNDELFGLVGGNPPSAAAPPGFTYVPFAFLLEVQGGQIVSAEQVWTP